MYRRRDDFEVLPGVYGRVETPVAYADGVVYAAAVNMATPYTATGFEAVDGTEAVQNAERRIDLEAGTGEIVALDAASGEILWSHEVDSPPFGGVTVVNDLLVASTFHGTIFALERERGERVWSAQFAVPLIAWPAVVGDTLLIGAGANENATFTAFRLGAETEATPIKEERAHTEIQWLLLKLGSDMGLDVWVARNDRGREWRGQRFADLPRLRADIPRQFDSATNSTIELIDVLWLRTTSIVAAFEIESTTSIYSGLLRMSDLIAMQPNINIPLYLVAPDERRRKVREEITRPTFSRMTPPLKQVCRYLAFSTIRDRLPTEPYLVRYLNPSFIDALAESFDD